MPVTVDARGLPCPQPVILTRNAMRESDQVTTLVSQPDHNSPHLPNPVMRPTTTAAPTTALRCSA